MMNRKNLALGLTTLLSVGQPIYAQSSGSSYSQYQKSYSLTSNPSDLDKRNIVYDSRTNNAVQKADLIDDFLNVDLIFEDPLRSPLLWFVIIAAACGGKSKKENDSSDS